MRRASRRARTNSARWWNHAVSYTIDVRAFSDSDGDGTGDLEGVRHRLGYLELLGVDALRLRPFFPSSGLAHGEDITEARGVDPPLGDLAGFDALLADIRECGLRVVLDVIGHHTSSHHAWFHAALAGTADSAQRQRYHFREGAGPSGDLPPNDWLTPEGTPAWSRAPDGLWYLHLFGPDLPDLNWTYPEVRADFEDTLRFWLDRGVDGVHVRNAHAMVKPDASDDNIPGSADPRFDHEGTHEIHRMLRAVVDTYPGSLLWGEVPVSDPDRFTRYLREDELHLASGHRLSRTAFDADAIEAAIKATMAAATAAGAPPVWSFHGASGTPLASRYDTDGRGLDRARAMALVQLGLPGWCCINNGDELGLFTHHASDSGGHNAVPWEGATVPGISTVEAQLEDTDSTLSLYRQAIELRREHAAFTRTDVEWYGAPPGCFAYRRGPGGLICVLNASGAPVPLPPGEPLLSSTPLSGNTLPTDAAAWLV